MELTPGSCLAFDLFFLSRLIVVSEGYHHALSKKKPCDVLDGAEKMLPVDALGLVMIAHGEEFREDSIFGAFVNHSTRCSTHIWLSGNALVKLGRAHCKIATLQEAYALTFKDTFLTSMERFKGEIKEYELLKKKLESQRCVFTVITPIQQVSEHFIGQPLTRRLQSSRNSKLARRKKTKGRQRTR